VIFIRNSNPTTSLFEETVAALKGAKRAASFVTGMAAISRTLFALLSLRQGGVTVFDTYGDTFLLFTQVLPEFGVICEVWGTDNHEPLEASIGRGCDLVYLESPTNPTLKLLDLECVDRGGPQSFSTCCRQQHFCHTH
jgi:cystathionine gamma-synthase